jgi:hypothetical protein
MSSRLSIWGKALAAHPVKRENNRNFIGVPAGEKKAPKDNRGPETTAYTEPAKAEVRDIPEFQRPATAKDQTSVYHTPDAWDRKAAKPRPARPYAPSEFPPGRPRMKKEQRRRNTISIALSEEEENLVRAAAADRGLSISDWARKAFFRYMGRKPPVRDMRRVDWSKGPEIIRDDED